MAEMKVRPVWDCVTCGITVETEAERDKHSNIPIIEPPPVGLVYRSDGGEAWVVSGEGKINGHRKMGFSPHTYESPVRNFYRGNIKGFSISSACPNEVNSGLFKDLLGIRFKIYSESDFEQIIAEMSPYVNVTEHPEREYDDLIIHIPKLIRTNEMIDSWLAERATG